MKELVRLTFTKGVKLLAPLLSGLALAVVLLILAHLSTTRAVAAPIDPPLGYPKFNQSTLNVSPTLAYPGGATLEYVIQIINTGACSAENVTLEDVIPANTQYVIGSGQSSVPPAPIYDAGMLTWTGPVGFDDRAVITFSVEVLSTFEGLISNTAIIYHDQIPQPITMTVETRITSDPLLEITKSAEPALPGANQPLTYTLTVVNVGQPAANLPITVTEHLPLNTTFLAASSGAMLGPGMDVITWTLPVTLLHGETSVFTFSVQVDDVVSGTVLNNEQYQVENPLSGLAVGEPYTLTVVDPILFVNKIIIPDPPGSNGEATYRLTVLNKGSKATDLLITDLLPANVTYLSGGTLVGGTVEWHLSSLDTGEVAYLTFTVWIDDIAAVDILNSEYEVCSAEEVCASGAPLSATVGGPTFEAWGWVDPIAKAPGGGGTPVTPTLVVRNLGPGNALDAHALLNFNRISVQLGDLVAIPPVGQFYNYPECSGVKCVAYLWIGNIASGETITFTTLEGQNSIGGEEGTLYTATLVITDSLGGYITDPITGTGSGVVTHYANLIPSKQAPGVIGTGQMMTYTINVFNSGQSTEEPPYPYLTETVPASVTLVSIGDGGISYTVGTSTVISWSLPAMNPGDLYSYHFVVQVPIETVSGTLIVNDRYRAFWSDTLLTGTITGSVILSNTGVPITTVVKEVGLVDSYKEVMPTLLRPGVGHVLTYVMHVVNSGPVDIFNAELYDTLPWESTTYQRDAVASAGQVFSDIVSIQWIGDVAAFSEERITFTVWVDDYFEGVITNTAVITHPSLNGDVVRYAVTYVTNDPVLSIYKQATPSPVLRGQELLYTIHVTNLGQQASGLVVTDTLPVNTQYVPGSATAGGQLVGGQVQWNLPVLEPGEAVHLSFKVIVLEGEQVVNSAYGVACSEGVTARGEPVITPIITPFTRTYLPTLLKSP